MRALVIAALLHVLGGCASAPAQDPSTAAPSRAAPADDTVVAVIPLEHAVAEQTSVDLRNLLGARSSCRLVANVRSNTIVAVGTADEIARVTELVAGLDTPPIAGR